MKERISGYVFKTVWRKGKDHAIPDALSLAPVNDPQPDDTADDPVMLSHIRAVIACRISTIIGDDGHLPHLIDPMLEELRVAAAADPKYAELVQAVENGFPSDSEKLEPSIRQFLNVRNELRTDEGLVLYGSRLVIPVSKRTEILSKLHAAHQGIERSKRRARQVVYWPGMSSDITNTVRACVSCQEALPSLQREPLAHDPLPTRVFEDVSVDIFSFAGNHYFTYADRLSGWPAVHVNYLTKDVTQFLTRNFVDLGVPVRMRSDGGPQFDSAEMRQFVTKWAVRQEFSTPTYAQSNGHAEAAVKAMRALIT